MLLAWQPFLHKDVIMKCLIFAAGLGTRLKPLTDHLPKALVSVAGVSLLEHTIVRLRNAGATEIVVNAHHFAEQIEEFLKLHDFGLPIYLSDERERLLDTGGGLRKAIPLFQEKEQPILIHNVDIFSNAPLKQFYEDNLSQDAALLVSKRNSTRQLYFDAQNDLIGWKNLETGEVRPQGSILITEHLQSYAFSGIHLISPRMISELNRFPEKFSIMDFYLSSCSKIKIKGIAYPDLRLLDVGKADTISIAEQFITETLA